jgi:glycosyltransferase involved in cell wall biosynthesis
LPVVGSRLVADLLNWEQGADLVVAETGDPEAFACQVVAAYRDRALWEQMQRRGASRAAADANPVALSGQVAELLDEL